MTMALFILCTAPVSIPVLRFAGSVLFLLLIAGFALRALAA
jgi:hypothetical protein